MQEIITTARLKDRTRNEKFDLEVEKLENYEHMSMDTNETFSTSGFTLILKRNPTPFFMNIYLPTGLLTLLSFIGFLIPVEMVPGRMALIVTLFLMFVNIKSTEQSRGPMVSKAVAFY